MSKANTPEPTMPLAEAINELQRGLRVFKAFEHAEELCTTLQGAEQQKRELQAAVEALTAERETLTADTLKLKEASKKAKAEVERVLDEAQGGAESIIATGQQSADHLIAQGQAKADEMVAAAQAQVDAINAQIQTRNEANQALAAEAADLEQRVADAKAFLAKLQEV